MELHEVARFFPRMPDDKFEALVEDIRVHGVRQPILVYDGQILDGRHRWEACEELGIPCPSMEWVKNGSVIDLVVSLNRKRRDLTQSQAAAIAVYALPLYKAEAEERQGTRTDLQAQMPEGERGQARDHAARAFNVSPRYVEDAKWIRERSEERFQEVWRGKRTIAEVKTELKRKERTAAILERAATAPAPGEDEAYPVLYADPPWRYDFTLSESRAVENQYPTWSVEELEQYPAPAGEDCVLFLWATSPKLPEALRVLAAWGFDYKTCLVWVKDKIGMGHYARQQHELLLVGARGSLPVPAPETRPPSVIEADRREHSRKPDCVYDKIEAMYPEYAGYWCELFQRWPRENWVGKGFEA